MHTRGGLLNRNGEEVRRYVGMDVCSKTPDQISWEKLHSAVLDNTAQGPVA